MFLWVKKLGRFSKANLLAAYAHLNASSVNIKPLNWQSIILFSVPLLLLLFLSGYLVYRSGSEKSMKELEQTSETKRQVVSDGRIEPDGEVLLVSAPFTMERSRVSRLYVKRGDEVIAGSIIAILDSYSVMKAAFQTAMADRDLAAAQLQQVRAGAKSGDIAAQKARLSQTKAELNGQIATQEARITSLKAQLTGESSSRAATVKRIQSELIYADRECARYQALNRSGAISDSHKESMCLQRDKSREQLIEAKAMLTQVLNVRQAEISEAYRNLSKTKETLSFEIKQSAASYQSISEVRSVDIAVAESELASAASKLKHAQANLNLAIVKSPISGRVLDIHTYPGEVATEGIISIGHTNRMLIVSEVYETDITNIAIGQRAFADSPALKIPLEGRVAEIGWLVDKKGVLNDDPVISTDSRIVQVRILLNKESSQRVSKLTNLKVVVRIAY